MHLTFRKNFVKFGHTVFEISEQTDMHTAIYAQFLANSNIGDFIQST